MNSPKNPFADEPLAQNPQLRAVGDLSNPYAAPTAVDVVNQEPPPGVGMWCDGSSLVMHQRALFPARCLITGAYTGKRYRQIVVCKNGLASRTMTADFGLAPPEKRRLWWRRLLAMAVCFAPFVLLILIPYEQTRFIAFFGIMVICGPMLIVLDITVGRLLKFEKAERSYYWLRGAGKPFLDTLPQWPGFN